MKSVAILVPYGGGGPYRATIDVSSGTWTCPKSGLLEMDLNVNHELPEDWDSPANGFHPLWSFAAGVAESMGGRMKTRRPKLPKGIQPTNIDY